MADQIRDGSHDVLNGFGFQIKVDYLFIPEILPML